MDANALGDLFADRLQGIESGHRFLKHHADVIAAQIAQGLFVCVEDFLAAKTDRTGVEEPLGSNCMIERAVSDLPEPDSPTSPVILPL